MSPPTSARGPRLTWLQGRAEPFFVALHHCPGARAAGVGVVLCPPFGWEEMSSYGPRRTWAQALADAGIPTVRLDLPGQGDAGGDPLAPDRVPAWTDAIATSAAWLRAETGCRRVVAIGISLGGLLALRAAAEGAPIDDFVLWGAPRSGKAFTRELGVFARMEAERLEPADRERLESAIPDGGLAAGGYLLSAQTRSDLDATSADALALPQAPLRSALVLGRDGAAPDKRLVEALRSQGLRVETGTGRGYGAMLVEPQFARAPEETVARSLAFARELDPDVTPSADAAPPGAPSPAAADEIEVDGPGGRRLRERLVELDGPYGAIVGVLTHAAGESAEGAPLLVLFGGTGHRIGPNRLWVEVARRWAAKGVTALRVDLAGAGDTSAAPPPDVPSLYKPEMIAEARWVVDEATRLAHAPQTACVGMCAAAYWALQASLGGRADVSPFMINVPTLDWSDEGHAVRALRRYRRLLFQRETWTRLRRGELSLENARRILLGRVTGRLRALASSRRGAAPAEPPAAARVLDGLRDQGTGAWMFFTGQELLRDELEREGVLDGLERWPRLRIDVVPGESDLHTLRPLWVQQRLHERIDAALAAELAHSPARA